MKIQVKEEWLNKTTSKYKCPFCDKEYSKKGISTHIWRAHGDGQKFDPNIGYKTGKRTIWNKGLTSEDPRVRKSNISYKQTLEKIKTERPEEYRQKFCKSPTEENKKNISESMKKAHAEGRAWNIGMSRWNNTPSYPEKFFMEVIENEFQDKNYVREYNVGIYSIDFAWPEKKLAIEIDGEQHYRFDDYKERDNRKDILLTEKSWTILRIRWTDMFKEPKKYIKLAKDFIETN